MWLISLSVGATSLCTGSDEVPSDAPDYIILQLYRVYNVYIVSISQIFCLVGKMANVCGSKNV